MTARGGKPVHRRKTARRDWIHGAIVVDKPSGMSSGAVVDELRRRLVMDGVGHTGTLDPLASGVLPIVLGQATKLAGYLLADDKAYDAVIELGIETDTLDRTGTVVAQNAEAAMAVTEAAVRALLATMVGPQLQAPPAYSAIKVDGRRNYQRARLGEVVTSEPRPVVIHSLTLTNFALPRLEVSVSCSKGTFIRSLAHDIGRALGCGAHVAELRRTQAGRFSLADTTTLLDVHRGSVERLLVSLPNVSELPRIEIDDVTALEAEHGRRVPATGVFAELEAGQRVQLVTSAGWVIAIAEVVGGEVNYERVLRRDDFDSRARVARGLPA